MSLSTAKEIALSAFSLYRGALPKCLWRVLPLLALSLAIDPITGPTGSAGSALSAIVSFLIDSVAGAIALAALLRAQFPNFDAALSVRSVVALVATEFYVALITILAALLLVLPAFWVAGATFLSPVFAFAYGQGPSSAVASSVQFTKGHLRPLLLIVVFYLLASVAGMAIVYVLPTPIDAAASLALSVAWLYYYALAVVVFARLHPNEIRVGPAHRDPVAAFHGQGCGGSTARLVAERKTEDE